MSEKRPRVRKLEEQQATLQAIGSPQCPKCTAYLQYDITRDAHFCRKCGYDDRKPDEPQRPKVPGDWERGNLLNVQNSGGQFRVCLLGEEFDPERPERTLFFQDSFECQQFVSWWYAREQGGLH